MKTSDQNWNQLARVYWLLPAAFVVHDAEELLIMPAWVASHREELSRAAEFSGLSRALVDSLPTTTAATAGAIACVLVVFLTVTIGATIKRGRGFWQNTYACVLGVFFLHAFTHAGQSIYFGGYTPGVVGAILVVVPASLYIYRRLFRANLLSVRPAVVAALVGFALFVPGVLLALSIGHWLAAN